MRFTRVCVIGAGSWGTTVAAMVARRAPVCLWARSADLAGTIATTRENPAYLPGVVLPEGLECTAELARALAGAEVVFMAVPSHGVRAVVEAMAPFVGGVRVIVSLAKGLEGESNLRMSQVIHAVIPHMTVGVLTGPNLAQEVAAGQPAAAVVALADRAAAQGVQELLHSHTFRVYTGTDVVGCEIAGATKNVLAIAVGISDGLGFGDNTRAVLITRGLAELGRLGAALGGKTLTFGGLAGIGDLVATCTSARSRNRMVGVALGSGRPLSEVVASMKMVAEGIKTAGPVVALARARGVEVPIAEQVQGIVEGRSSPREALEVLMGRPARAEWDRFAVPGDQP